LRNPSGLPVAALAYPYVAGIGGLGAEGGHDELVHPYATGFLVRDPLRSLPAATSETEGQEPVLLGLYPEGFSGSTMQFMAYSAPGRGGFYVAAEDCEGHEKWLNFYLHAGGDLRLSVWHAPRDYARHRDVEPAYPTRIAALDGGTWYDAADRYKSWARGRPWTAQGPLAAREDRCRWLLEEVGLCTFGIDPRHDRSPWLERIGRLAGTPVLHVLGPSWARTGADYMNHLPGGLPDWFPAAFESRNREAIARSGDFLVPFEFDLLFGEGPDAAERERGEAARQQVPSPTLSRDAYAFPFLCPGARYARELHVERDRRLAQEHDVDGVYYDISVNNVRHRCLASGHGHPPGEMQAVTLAYRDQLADTRQAMREAANGRAMPQGTELINEQLIPFVDFYQARAEAGLAAPFEGGPFRELIKAGTAQKIPLFAYVYHEYGPVRLDGWAKLSREQGTLVFHTLGQVFLNGGLVELNYEFSALEVLDEGRHDEPEEHYYRFEDRRYAVDGEVARFAGALARMRVGAANRYLAYGTMQRPAAMTVRGGATVELDYFLFNCDTSHRDYEDRGVLRVPAVSQSAWRSPEGSRAWLFLNVAAEPREVTVDLETAPGRRLVWRGAMDRSEDVTAGAGGAHTRTLPARRPVMLEEELAC
ncbi:MAG: hypothetical protein J2P38_05995, partial [Candidatus Dormibacteraeota bacterium]|nr:hypothetical protein [Candidatus Dormibacteraeota bacterium]